MHHVCVLFCGNVAVHHERVCCVLSNQEWFLSPFGWIDVLCQFLDFFAVPVNHTWSKSLKLSGVLQVHWSDKVVWVILKSECTGIPERVEVWYCSVEEFQMKKVSSSISLGISFVIKCDWVQRLMNIADHMDKVASKEGSFSSNVLEISFESSSGLFNSDDWSHGGFSVVNNWNGGVSDIRSKVSE